MTAQPPPAPERIRVAVLGGGPAGLATAFALSDDDQLRARYEVHVYQAGGHLGGKCRAIRSAERYLRIEQNSSHYLFGCYHNTFDVFRRTFEELEQRHGVEATRRSFGSFDDEILARSYLVSKQEQDGKLYDWFRPFPTNLGEPGQGSKYLTVFDSLWMALWLGLEILLCVLFDDVMRPFVGRLLVEGTPFCRFGASRGRSRTGWARWWRGTGRVAAAVVNGASRPVLTVGRWLARWLWEQLLSRPGRVQLVRRVRARAIVGVRAARRAAHSLLGAARRWALDAGFPGAGLRLRRLEMFTDVGLTIVAGVLREALWRPGAFHRADQRDLREWLKYHGLAAETADGCSLLSTWYDAIASYEDGDRDRPRISAGVSLYALFRALLTYKGAFAFQLQNEVGDAMIAPLYQLLVDRGVKFHFYCRVRKVMPGRDGAGPLIDHVEIEDQLDTPYDGDPLATLPSGRRYWPASQAGPRAGDAPAQGQSVDGGASLDDESCDGEPFESFWAKDSGRRRRLRTRRPDDRGEFDHFVFALPVGVIDYLCPEILSENESWREMRAAVRTTDTQSIRMWFKDDLQQLGWTGPPPILSSFSWPFNTWEHNDAGGVTGNFPDDQKPRAIATVFGPLQRKCPEGGNGVSDPAETRARVHASAVYFATHQIQALWPGLRKGDAIDWDVLCAPPEISGPRRFDWQHLSVNAGPVESYPLAMAGSLSARLRPDESGFRNLFLAGEWTRNGVEIGCLEAAFMSGLAAAQSLSGSPRTILGARDLDFGLL